MFLPVILRFLFIHHRQKYRKIFHINFPPFHFNNIKLFRYLKRNCRLSIHSNVKINDAVQKKVVFKLSAHLMSFRVQSASFLMPTAHFIPACVKITEFFIPSKRFMSSCVQLPPFFVLSAHSITARTLLQIKNCPSYVNGQSASIILLYPYRCAVLSAGPLILETVRSSSGHLRLPF